MKRVDVYLKQAHLETAARIFRVRKLSLGVKRAQRFAPPPFLRKTGEGIESSEMSVHVADSLSHHKRESPG
jgi:hypothetical protein